jgi:hypothetical protein
MILPISEKIMLSTHTGIGVSRGPGSDSGVRVGGIGVAHALPPRASFNGPWGAGRPAECGSIEGKKNRSISDAWVEWVVRGTAVGGLKVCYVRHEGQNVVPVHVDRVGRLSPVEV